MRSTFRFCRLTIVLFVLASACTTGGTGTATKEPPAVSPEVKLALLAVRDLPSSWSRGHLDETISIEADGVGLGFGPCRSTVNTALEPAAAAAVDFEGVEGGTFLVHAVFAFRDGAQARDALATFIDELERSGECVSRNGDDEDPWVLNRYTMSESTGDEIHGYQLTSLDSWNDEKVARFVLIRREHLVSTVLEFTPVPDDDFMELYEVAEVMDERMIAVLAGVADDCPQRQCS